MPDLRLLASLVVVLVAYNVLANRLLPDADVVLGLCLTALLLLAARALVLTRSDLGLGKDHWASGARYGLTATAVVAAGYAAILLVPQVRTSLTQPSSQSVAGVAVMALVVIPLATVIPEELAFRGVLWGALSRTHSTRTATLASSLLFGLWHVLPALGGGAANDAADDVLSEGTTGVVLRVIVTVVFTGVAGMLLCELRRRSGSLLAPILLHWAVNGLGVVAVAVAG